MPNIALTTARIKYKQPMYNAAKQFNNEPIATSHNNEHFLNIANSNNVNFSVEIKYKIVH